MVIVKVLFNKSEKINSGICFSQPLAIGPQFRPSAHGPLISFYKSAYIFLFSLLGPWWRPYSIKQYCTGVRESRWL